MIAFLRQFLQRFASFFRRAQLDQDLEAEMASHLELAIEDNLRNGMSPAEARRQALIHFGGTQQAEENHRESRGIPFLETLAQDIRYSLRMLRKSPGFTAVAVLTLTIGIGGNAAMFSLVHAAILRPLPYKDPARLVFARCTIGGVLNPVVSGPDYYDYREQSDAFDGFSAVLGGVGKTTLIAGSEPERTAFTYIAFDLFRTLGVAPEAGRWFTSEEGRAGGPDVILVSGRFARRRFDTPDHALGASITLDGRSYTVVGVMPASFRFLHDVDVWLPMRRGEAAAGVGRQFHNWLIVARLKPGVSRESAQRQVDVISKRLEQQYPASNTGKALQLDPLQSALEGPRTPRLLVLMAAVGLVLLIACANVAGLLLARGSARRSELAMRAALGASRARIARQLMTESTVLALFSGVLGVMLASWLSGLLPMVAGLRGTEVAPKAMEWPVLLFALGLSALVGVLFGVAPALSASDRLLTQGFAQSTRATMPVGRAGLRRALVIGQVAVSLVLLVGAGLLIRSFAHLAGINPGFEVQHLLTGEIQLLETQYPKGDQRIQFLDGLHEDFVRVPGVKAVGFVSDLPIRHPSFDLPAWDADHPPTSPAYQRTAHRRVVLPGYFDALRIPLLSGRDFGPGDRENTPPTMVINERMARTLFADGKPLGRRVSVDMFGPRPTTFEVVGVVGDARIAFVGDSAPMTMYMSYYQFPDATMRFAIRTDQVPQLITQSVRQLVRARDWTIPVENLVSMEDLIGESLAPQQVAAVTLALFAFLAVSLTCIGLYGVLAYSVSQRTHEIGIRLALGGNHREVLWLVLRQGMTLAFSGLAIGIVAAFELSRLLSNMLFGIAPHDPVTFAAVSVLVMLVAALACAIPARRAIRLDPMVALRYE